MIEVEVAEHYGHRLDTVEQRWADVQCTETGSGIEHQGFGAGGDQIAACLAGAGGNPSTATEHRHPHG